MQIYLNIFKKSKIINYKDNIFLLSLNTSLLLHFISQLLLQNVIFNSTKLTKLLIFALLRSTLVKIPFLSYLSNEFFLINCLTITTPFHCNIIWKHAKNNIYPVLKSPFIYKKAFRHFSHTNYEQQVRFFGKPSYLKPMFTINPLKFELLNSFKSMRVIEKQLFIIY